MQRSGYEAEVRLVYSFISVFRPMDINAFIAEDFLGHTHTRLPLSIWL